MYRLQLSKPPEYRSSTLSIFGTPPITTWYYCCSFFCRMITLMLHVDWAQKWLWYDSVYTALLCVSCFCHYTRPQVIIL
ncbi:uncharacterized protein BDR25DRAFT_303891 [Lindgomyces ingoldianus]|uniref:Uncharacterized protein n=1 Tax=Lindgomyces ingoldianus TaxID=673940 RepID=A0ACB6QTP7_9PLEO|nr:uncharacterized protein BDR25DRAFT_303891 [Lindgomyces ingoldianus]KAF2470379.1 hypothetical protein BDR25DRAFT_303891 [Lindgomyces ingoldianus]